MECSGSLFESDFPKQDDKRFNPNCLMECSGSFVNGNAASGAGTFQS